MRLEDARNALSLNGLEIAGRTIKVSSLVLVEIALQVNKRVIRDGVCSSLVRANTCSLYL